MKKNKGTSTTIRRDDIEEYIDLEEIDDFLDEETQNNRSRCRVKKGSTTYVNQNPYDKQNHQKSEQKSKEENN